MYKGGKNGNGSFQTIINQIPEHSIYVEPFAGSAAIYFNKRMADISLLFDKLRNQTDLLSKKVSPGDIVQCCDSVVNINLIVSFLNIFHSYGHRVFMYCDPPYPLSSRSYQKSIYEHEMTDADHIAFLTGMDRALFPISISTYENDIYSQYLSNWRLLKYQSIVRGGTRTEFLYMNYPETSQLHDFSYIGNAFRDRERLKRIKNNFLSKFDSMQPILKNAITAALNNESKIRRR
jgi:16S rRNA G966 N2-methylase RsmD